MERRDGWNVDHGAVGSLVTVKKVSEVIACAVFIAVAVVSLMVYAVYKLVDLIIPVSIFVNWR